jgi:hypothetical protein
MTYSYSEVELGSIRAVAKSQRKLRLDDQTEGRAKHIHALVLQSVHRHGKHVSPHVVKKEVYNAMRRSGRYGNPILILLLPFLIQFIQAIWPVVLQYIMDWLNSLAEDEQPKALMALAAPAKVKFSLDI